MMNFHSLTDFTVHLIKAVTAEAVALHEGLERCAVLIEETAKSEFGTLQPAVGPFPEWEELAQSTVDKKGHDAPLIDTSELSQSISHVTEGLEAVIGSTDPKMVYHEFGTPHIPPRPVLGPAAYRNKEKIQKIIGAAAISGLMAGAAIPEGLGYEMEIG